MLVRHARIVRVALLSALLFISPAVSVPQNVPSVSKIKFALESLPFRVESDETLKTPHAPATMAGGVAVFDYNKDGRPDIFFTNGANIRTLKKDSQKFSNHLYRNDGNGVFTDVTQKLVWPARDTTFALPSAITTMTAIPISSLGESTATRCTTTTARNVYRCHRQGRPQSFRRSRIRSSLDRSRCVGRRQQRWASRSRGHQLPALGRPEQKACTLRERSIIAAPNSIKANPISCS